MTDLTVVILTKNEEKNLRKCVESFRGVAKRFVIVDSFSTDGTEALCKELNTELQKIDSSLDFYQNKWISYADQLNWGLRNTGIDTEWSMRMDADEEIMEDLYNANYKISADHEYTMKLWKAQVPFWHTKNTVCMYEGGGISESSTGWKNAVSERTRIRKQYYSKKSRVKYELILFFSFSKLRAWIDSEKSPQCINKIYVSIRNRTFSKK